ncbi:MAG: ABC transporter permease [Deinococcales bacterium]
MLHLTRVLSMFKAPLALWGLWLLVGLALFAPAFFPNPNAQNLTAVFTPPFSSWSNPLGSDELGRSILAQLLHGLRVSLLVGVVCSLLSAGLGVGLGLLAGWNGGVLDRFIMRATEVQMALPTMLLALVCLGVFGAGLVNLILVIGVFGWAGFARLTRGVVLSQRQLEYVLAADALGVSGSRLLLRHMLPNIASGLVLQMALDMPQNILLEGSLSFLGVGVGVDTPSLGTMMARGYAHLFSGAWWLGLLPGLLLLLLVLCCNALTEWLRKRLQPA